jgi:TPR repeat protein
MSGLIGKAYRSLFAADAFLDRKLGYPSKNLYKFLFDWDFEQADLADAPLISADPEWDRVAEAWATQARDPTAAVRVLEWAAGQGSMGAMVYLGLCYERGEGMGADAATAEAWRRRAFEAGSMRGLLDYGRMLRDRGELKLAEAVYRVGVEKDFVPAFYQLACVLLLKSQSREAFQSARPLFERALAGGSPVARWRYSRYLSGGRYGVWSMPRGYAMAVSLAIQIPSTAS